MATLVDSGTGTGDKGGTVSVSLTSAPTSGNALVFCAVWGNTSSTISTPNSMTSLGVNNFGGNRIQMFHKIADGTESATFSSSLSPGGVTINAVAAEFSGIDTFGSGVSNSGTGTTPTGASNGSADTELNVFVVGVGTSVGGLSSPSSGYTENEDFGVGGLRIGLFSNLTGAASSTPSCTSSNDDWYTWHLVFDVTPSGVAIPVAMRHLRNMQQNQRGR